MASLQRVKAGIFDIENALTREEIDAAYQDGTLAQKLVPLDAPLGHLPRVDLTEQAWHAVRNGNVLKPIWMLSPAPKAENVRIYLEGRFAGIGETQADGSVRFKAMLLGEDEDA